MVIGAQYKSGSKKNSIARTMGKIRETSCEPQSIVEAILWIIFIYIYI
jgi:hypothetical protein